MSVAAYKQTIRNSETPRNMERRVMSQVTAEMATHADAFDTATALERLTILEGGLRQAVWDNQKLWMALRNDLAQPENQLPQELRAQLISIALWVDRQSSRIVGGEPGVNALVAVNRQIVAGLSGVAPKPEEL